jgi:hypothetical protein
MGLFTGLLTLPLAPLRGVVAVADLIRREAEEAYYDPAAIRAELDEVDRLREAGEIAEDEARIREDELIDRLMTGQQIGREHHD